MSFYELNYHLKDDPLSCLSFRQDGMLLASSYDSSIRLYNNMRSPDPSSISLLTEVQSPSPVLSMACTKSYDTIVGLADGSLRHLDLENTRVSNPITQSSSSLENDDCNENGINQCKLTNNNSLIASTYNGSIWHVDPRSPHSAQRYQTSSKIFAMDITSQHVILGKLQQTIEIYDIRRLDSPFSVRPTGLRFQITCLKKLPSEAGYAVGSIDGRVSMDVINDQEDVLNQKFAFKCHRKKSPLDAVTVYPVTGLAFHPRHYTLFTSGGDGHVCLWNWEKRKRMKQLPSVPSPLFISHMELSDDGTQLALGVTDDIFLRGQNVVSPTERRSRIYVREISEIECKPK